MHSLIISCNGEDFVTISGVRQRLEAKAIDFIRKEINPNHGSWEDFGDQEIEKVLISCLEIGDADSAMELFADISDVRGDICFMRIVPAEMMMDA